MKDQLDALEAEASCESGDPGHVEQQLLVIARRLLVERNTAIGRCGYFQEQVDHLKSRMEGTSVIPCCSSKAEVRRLRDAIEDLAHRWLVYENRSFECIGDLRALLKEELTK